MSNLINQTKFKPIFLGVCLAVVFVCLVNPFGVASGNLDVDSYAEVRSLLSESKNAKLLYLSSDNDFFEFSATSKLRKKYGVEFVLEGASGVLAAASFGNWSFNKYLNNNEITHLIVPWSSAQKSKVVRKWGVHGSIAIELNDPFFIRKTVTSGEFPVALYEVVQTQKSVPLQNNYTLKWDDSTRKSFYLQVESLREIGLYRYEYNSNFQDGPTVSWVMADDMGVAENPAFEIRSSGEENRNFRLTIEFVAAYGSYAPDQVVNMSSGNWTRSVVVSSGNSERVVFDVKAGEVVKFSNGLPCRAASSFDPATSDTRRFCYGISSITVRPL